MAEPGAGDFRRVELLRVSAMGLLAFGALAGAIGVAACMGQHAWWSYSYGPGVGLLLTGGAGMTIDFVQAIRVFRALGERWSFGVRPVPSPKGGEVANVTLQRLHALPAIFFALLIALVVVAWIRALVHGSLGGPPSAAFWLALTASIPFVMYWIARVTLEGLNPMPAGVTVSDSGLLVRFVALGRPKFSELAWTEVDRLERSPKGTRNALCIFRSARVPGGSIEIVADRGLLGSVARKIARDRIHAVKG